MGFLQRLRSEVAPVVRCQPCPPLLRVDARQRCGGLPDRGAFGRGEVGRWARPETVRGLGLPERGPKGGADRVRHPAGHRALGEATRRTAARRDRPGESQARVRARGDTGHHAHWLGDANRGKDSGLHLRFSGQPAFGSASRKDQGALGVKSSQQTSSAFLGCSCVLAVVKEDRVEEILVGVCRLLGETLGETPAGLLSSSGLIDLLSPNIQEVVMLLRGYSSCLLDDHLGSPPSLASLREEPPLSQPLSYDTIWSSLSQWRTRTSKQRLMLSKPILNGPSTLQLPLRTEVKAISEKTNACGNSLN